MKPVNVQTGQIVRQDIEISDPSIPLSTYAVIFTAGLMIFLIIMAWRK